MIDRRTDMQTHGVSVVLGSFNRKSLLKLTIDSVRRELDVADFPHEIIVVDGGSTDGTPAWLARQKDIISLVQHNRGKWRGKPIERRSWGYFMNLGFKCAQGKYVCMLSDDALVVPGAIKLGIAHFERRLADGANVGAVPFYFLNYPFEPRYYVISLGNYLYVNHGLYLNDALRSVGYIDELSYRFYAADVDLCLRMRAKGYSIEPCPDSKVIHFIHANLRGRGSNQLLYEQDERTFRSKWLPLLEDLTPDLPYSRDRLPQPFARGDFYRSSLALGVAKLQAQLFWRLTSGSMRRLIRAVGEDKLWKLLAKR
jgi:GT2 family glycosyltransferase